MNITDLGGHSGCKVLLIEEDNNIVVRKISGSVEYNSRLRIQAQKQADFRNTTLKAPKVYCHGMTEDGLFYFDMEYVQGITLAEHLKTVEIGKLNTLVDTIVTNLASAGAGDRCDPSIFQTKIASLTKTLSAHRNDTITRALDLLAEHDWSLFKKTPCHGDLTLENIIVKDGQLYIIDFLDSFYDCWILDISTLMQDVQTLWSYRFQKNLDINTVIRLIVFRDLLMEKVRDTIGEDSIEVYYALLLKLIRIYPYTKDDYTYQFLNDKVNILLNIIEGRERV